MDALERGKGWPLARTSQLWMKLSSHSNSGTGWSGGSQFVLALLPPEQVPVWLSALP